MRAGRLRQIITIKKKSGVKDSSGEETITWVALTNDENIYAAVEPVSGKEYFEAKQIHADISTRILVRYLNGVTANMRVHHGNDVYEIISPPIDKGLRHRELELMCRLIDPVALAGNIEG